MIRRHASNQVTPRSEEALITPRLLGSSHSITKKQINNNRAICPESVLSQAPGVFNQLPLSHVCSLGSHTIDSSQAGLPVPSLPSSLYKSCPPYQAQLFFEESLMTSVSPLSFLYITQFLQKSL